MKAVEHLTAQDHKSLQEHTSAVDNIFGLPPGTILKIILGILTGLGGILGGGGTTPPAK